MLNKVIYLIITLTSIASGYFFDSAHFFVEHCSFPCFVGLGIWLFFIKWEVFTNHIIWLLIKFNPSGFQFCVLKHTLGLLYLINIVNMSFYATELLMFLLGGHYPVASVTCAENALVTSDPSMNFTENSLECNTDVDSSKKEESCERKAPETHKTLLFITTVGLFVFTFYHFQ